METAENRLLNFCDKVFQSINSLHEQFQSLPTSDRVRIIDSIISINASLLSIYYRAYQTSRSNIGILPSLRFAFSDLFEPVLVIPTQEQINNALIPIESASGNCAICQEQFSSNVVKLRHCEHAFHRNCISQWFRSATRCPVCRHDIREEGPEDRMTSVSE